MLQTCHEYVHVRRAALSAIAIARALNRKLSGSDTLYVDYKKAQLIENAYGTNSPGMALMDPFCPPYKAYMRSINAL